ncbi:MAG: DUF1573 domain-containing protein [Cytophagales bacterium]|nr:DUF1573 domain-containing protein [Cytophagales bacterium]
MRYKSSLFLSAVLLVISNTFTLGQRSQEIQFNETTFDFGNIKEGDGPVTHEFSFINRGQDPVTITGVRASCGCTTPAWTKEPVAPGQPGMVQARYNPKGRPGAFNKSLTVSLDSSTEPVRLYIKGYVEPKSKTLQEDLPTAMGGLRLKYRSFNFGKVQATDKPAVKEFEVYNDTEQDIEFLDSLLGPAHIQFEFDPQALAPQQRGVIRVTYHAKMLNDLGFMNHNMAFYTNEAGEDNQKSVSVYATVEEYFPPMTQAELAEAPKMEIKEAIYDFGRIKRGEVVSNSFELTNTGQNPLEIRTHKTNCSCIKAEVSGKTIRQGETATVEVTFDAEGRRGNQQKSVTIYTNDPRASAQRVTIKAYVENSSR